MVNKLVMRIVRMLIPFFLICLVACKKDNDSNRLQGSLEGEWKLVFVKDKSNGAIISKPTGYVGDIILKFSGNSFTGHTLINTISGGSYSLTGTDFVVGCFSMTKVGEEEWGNMFLTVLWACGLQSTTPCAPSNISFQGNRLIIESPLRYDLTLERN